MLLAMPLLAVATAAFLSPAQQKQLLQLYRQKDLNEYQERVFDHIIPPDRSDAKLSQMTLREFLLHPRGVHLALAPAFFGFYAYFGALDAWEHEVMWTDDPPALPKYIRSVAGGSAGAMAAVLLAAGIPPGDALQFASSVTLGRFADPPGLGGLFRGELFEGLMRDFILSKKPTMSMRLEDGVMPVAVSGFDLKTMKGQILSRGDMARAARASACFPVLFQPVQWNDENGTVSYLIDGGISDDLGLQGLSAFRWEEPMRVVNVVVGNFFEDGPRGPSNMPNGVNASEVVSISIRNTPRVAPWAMENGPIAAEAARVAMLSSLHLPLYEGTEPGHYELHIDATEFIR